MKTDGGRPQAVELVSRLFWALVLGGLLVSVLVVMRRHEIADAWSPLHPTDSTIRPVSFVPVVLVLYGFIAVTVVILVGMLRRAQEWTRWGLSIIGLGLFLGSFAVLRTAPPVSIRCVLTAAAALAAVALLLLWHPSVGGYLRARDDDEQLEQPDEQETAANS